MARVEDKKKRHDIGTALRSPKITVAEGKAEGKALTKGGDGGGGEGGGEGGGGEGGGEGGGGDGGGEGGGGEGAHLGIWLHSSKRTDAFCV